MRFSADRLATFYFANYGYSCFYDTTIVSDRLFRNLSWKEVLVSFSNDVLQATLEKIAKSVARTDKSPVSVLKVNIVWCVS